MNVSKRKIDFHCQERLDVGFEQWCWSSNTGDGRKHKRSRAFVVVEQCVFCTKIMSRSVVGVKDWFDDCLKEDRRDRCTIVLRKVTSFKIKYARREENASMLLIRIRIDCPCFSSYNYSSISGSTYEYSCIVKFNLILSIVEIIPFRNEVLISRSIEFYVELISFLDIVNKFSLLQ